MVLTPGQSYVFPKLEPFAMAEIAICLPKPVQSVLTR